MVEQGATDRLLVDVAADGRVTVSTWLDGELPGGPVGEPVELVWPLDDRDLEELRWYLEDYLRAPFGVYEDRGPLVEARLPGWGEAIFAAVFGPSGPVRDALVRLRARGTATELVFRAASAQVLGLPWELLRDPARPTPLALDRVAVSRSLPTAALADTFRVGGSRLRVLMVISRPGGTEDVGYRMIARPLLERLDAVRGNVDLVVLRPPTLRHLEEVLAQARTDGEPFQVVHFDGHGVLAGRPAAGWDPLSFRGSAPQGVLVFEGPGGGADRVGAAEVAAVLAAARVPVVVLNACQSGAVGKALEATVATRLLQEGAASVVAMAYSVYAVAAAEFMAAFYERLFAGDRVADAVSAGRRRLAQRNGRPSPKGPLPLADWMVPVHYARSDVRFPGLRTDRTAALSLDEMLDRIRHSGGGDIADPLAPVGGFVGRDGLFHTLEVATRLQRVVLLHGPGGTGKTELAKAFGRWWRDTGGVERPDWVIWHSFEPGLASFGLAGVVDTIGQRVLGVDFARLDAAERRRMVGSLLATRRLLLIWDNVESVHTMPDPTGATPRLGTAELAELHAFVAAVAAGGASALVLTSRSPEDWLGDVRRVEVGGLTHGEAVEYADELLAPYPGTAVRRQLPVFADLMGWLDGHPLSMRLVLPHLDSTDPDALLAGLRGTATLPGATSPGGRTTSLPASVAYSFDHLDPATQRSLVAVCLFHGIADANVLGIASGLPDPPDPFRGHDRATWMAALSRAAAVGLLSPVGAAMYRIHPALPAYLAATWRADDPAAYPARRAAAEEALLDAYAAFGGWLLQQIRTGEAEVAYAVVDIQRRNLGAMLGYALDRSLWKQAQKVAQPLVGYCYIRGLYEEARGWVDRARLLLESPDGTAPPLETPAGLLWIFLTGGHADRQANAKQLGQAERTYRDILRALQAQPESRPQRHYLAAAHYHLGRVAVDRARLDEAEDWCRRSLAITESLGYRSLTATNYHLLGMVAERRERWDEAEDRYRQFLALAKDLGERHSLSAAYHQLGVLAQRRERLDEAEDWYHKSLAITQDLGHRPAVAKSYHHLGMIAQLRGDLDEAEDWYRRSLTIAEDLGARPDLASTYLQLGTIAEGRGRTDEAEDWYRRSLAIVNDLGDSLPHAARTDTQTKETDR